MTFIPVLYAREHYSLVSIGTMISLFTVGGAISGLLAGHLSDRLGYKPIFFLTHGLVTFSLFVSCWFFRETGSISTPLWQDFWSWPPCPSA